MNAEHADMMYVGSYILTALIENVQANGETSARSLESSATESSEMPECLAGYVSRQLKTVLVAIDRVSSACVLESACKALRVIDQD